MKLKQKETTAQVFCCEFKKVFRTVFLQRAPVYGSFWKNHRLFLLFGRSFYYTTLVARNSSQQVQTRNVCQLHKTQIMPNYLKGTVTQIFKTLRVFLLRKLNKIVYFHNSDMCTKSIYTRKWFLGSLSFGLLASVNGVRTIAPSKINPRLGFGLGLVLGLGR